MSTELPASYDSNSIVRPRYRTLPKEWSTFVHFKPDKRGRKLVYFYHEELRLLTEEDIFDVETLEQVLDYAEQHLDVLVDEGSLERLPDDLEIEIFGVGHPRSTGVAMYSYSKRQGFTSGEDGEIETHPNEVQFWQHVERFPVHRITLPENADRDFRNALSYGSMVLDFPCTNTQIQDAANKYIELGALKAEGISVLPYVVWLIAGFMKEIHDPLLLTKSNSSHETMMPSICWRKYMNTADEDAFVTNKPRCRYYASDELRLVTDDDLCDPKILDAVLKIREDHLKYARAKDLQVFEDWEIEIVGADLFDGPRVAIFSYSQCTLYDARIAAQLGAIRSFWQIIEKYPMHRTYIPPKMEHEFLRALVEDSPLHSTQVQSIATRFWDLKASHANGQPNVVPHLVWLISKTMMEMRSGELPPELNSESNSSSKVKTVNKPRLKKLPSSWKEYVNLENWRYFHNPVLRLITLGDIYDPEIYEITLKTREQHFRSLENDGLMGKLPKDWEIIIFGQHHDVGPYVAMCSYDQCSKFLCQKFSPSQEAYWCLLVNFNMHREYIPEQLETVFLNALAESNNNALFPFTAQECQTLYQTYWELKAQRDIPALVLHVSNAMAKIEQSRELCDKFEHCSLE